MVRIRWWDGATWTVSGLLPLDEARALVGDADQHHVDGDIMSAKEYRPWEIPRLVGLCAGCGIECALTSNWLCQQCENKTRGNQAWAPALPPVTSGGREDPDPDASSFGSRPTIESAGSARFYGGSRDTW